MRQGELLALTWQNVDLVRRVVTVTKSKNKRTRDVPLTARAAAELEQIRAARTIPLNAPDRVFWWIPQNWPGPWARKYRDAVTAAKLPPLRFHDLRHLAAVNLVRAGTPLPDVAKMGGWQSLQMVWRYAHHAPVNAAEMARDRLEAYIADQSPDDDAAAASA